MCCDALGKINIFAGTEHDSANYGKVQESFRKHTAETANKGRAPPKGGVRYSYEGKNKDGIEVYETSNEVMNLSIAERNKRFLQLMKEKYRGRTAKFVRNGHAYYATFELEDVNKNIYGDTRSDEKGKKAKVRTGADGNIFELIENSHYNGSKPEYGKKSKPHKGIEYWDYFIKTVQIDNSIYDLVANVRKNKSNQYVYGIQLRENKKIKASPAVGSQNVSLSSAANTSEGSIRNSGENVKKYSAEPTDAAYMKSVERGDTGRAQRMIDEAAKKAGYTVKMYHGSKRGGGFTVFRDWSYFTKSKKYAQRYTERGNDNSLYSAYVKIENAFDTRKAADRGLFNEIRQEYGMGEIQDTGLPDWTDGYDIADYIDENGLNYDAIILDEGGDLVDGKPISRGLSYVIRNSNNIKSAEPITYDDNGNVIPLSERFKDDSPDIRYSREPESITELRRQNRELKKRVDYWKSQTQRTKVNKTNTRST